MQVKGIVNEIREQSGSTALEGVSMVIIYKVSQTVSTYSGVPIQLNKFIVGLNALKH
jgi:isopropylmalate/homocitrate/citramalate synthase